MKKLTKPEIVFSEIKDKIIKGELISGDRLSTVRTLANEFKVSDFTIIKAFELLEKEKLITRVLKSGVYIGTGIKKNPISIKKLQTKTRAREIAESIISQIIQGTLKVGEPMFLKKVLAFKYRATQRTIKKTIEILIEERYIHKDEFRYIIGQPTVSTIRPAKNRVYFLTEQEPASWRFLGSHNKNFFHPFNMELHKYGVTSLEFLDFWNEPDIIKKAEEATTAGFLLDFGKLGKVPNTGENLQTRFYKTAEIIGRKNLPLIINDYNQIPLQVADFVFKPMSNLFFIGYDDYKAGEKAGTYLVSMGHKRIAYFNVGNNPGNLQLFKGVESAMKKLFNNESNVFYFQVQSKDAYWHADLSTYAGTSEEKKKRFLDAYSGLFENYQFKMDDPLEEIYPALANHIYKDLYKKMMAPVFEKALGTKEITAWVGTSYYETVFAAEFLMEQKIDVPEKIGLFGFRDGDLSTEYEITTYNFMEGKAAYLAAHCILGDIPIKKNRKGYVEYEGQIMVRKSVKAI
jgi:DNA-binding transcriptional regulator YhcF (GntR family)/DNA-binding LacI/PurR family transcriptional regulator